MPIVKSLEGFFKSDEMREEEEDLENVWHLCLPLILQVYSLI